MRSISRTRAGDEDGIALIIAVVVLLLLSAIGLAALQGAQSELTAGGYSRLKTRTLYAADSGIGLVRNQLNIVTGASLTGTPYPDRNPIYQGTLMVGANGLFTEIRTGTADNATPQAIARLGTVRRDGDQVNVNSANSFSYGIYRADVAAVDPGGGSVELQAQFMVNEGSDSYR